MGFRVWLACNMTPLVLRLTLAATFLWAGYGKLAYNDPVSGEEAAILANLGVIKAPVSAPAPSAAPVEAPSEPAAPVESEPAEPAPQEKPEAQPADPAKPGAAAAQSAGRPEFAFFAARADEPSSTAPATMAPAPRQYTAEDFPNPVMVPRLYHIAAMLHRAAYPADPSRQLWPTQLADARTIVVLSWLAAITETAGGALVLFGFLTRIASLGLASTMLIAMLMTTIGPAAVSGEAFLGFLPPPRMTDPAAWGEAWTPMLFQFSLLMSSLGLLFAGPGGLSLDRLIFGGPREQSPRGAAPSKTA